MRGKFKASVMAGIVAILLFTSVSVCAAENDPVKYKGALCAQTIYYSTTQNNLSTEYTLEAGKPIVIPITVRNAGVLCCTVNVKSENTELTIYGYLHRNKPKFSSPETGPDACVDIGSSYLEGCIEGDWNLNMSSVVPSKTYYLTMLYELYENEGETVNVEVIPYVYTNENRALPGGNSNKWLISTAKNKDVIWHKVVPDRTGLMTVTMEGEACYKTTCYLANINLYNKNKKIISPTKSGRYYGVKQGTTYYLKLSKFDLNDLYEEVYRIKYSTVSGVDRALGAKSYAKKLIRKATATKTLFLATNTVNTDWYKIYVSEKRATRVTVDTRNMSGNVTVTAYKGTQKLSSVTVPSGRIFKGNINYGASNKATKGTYYIKVVKSAKASGRYSIRYAY